MANTDCCLLALFESKDWPSWSADASVIDAGGAADSVWLRQELASTKQYLQSVVDDQDAATQELRAAHEEVLSSNEELQSTNEELQTTKEELQSANEELTTVNEQFLGRNRELDALTDDLANFISSADIPMVTVGRDLRVRRLTPAAEKAFHLLPTLILNTRSSERSERQSFTILSVEDVTDARQAEILRIDAETLRLLDRRKDEFLGVLAHELRNPLAPMRFALELLRRSDGNREEMSCIRGVLDRQLAHMVRIVDDLLDVSRITQGKIELRNDRVDLAKLIAGAVELSRPAITSARQTLTVSAPDEPVTIQGDAVRLTQILVNLLNNATKFTPAGGHIWLMAETVSEEHGLRNQLRIRVRDTGVGIAKDLLPKIFDMFMQGDASLERSQGGLGIGLTLVQNLVARHGGTVDVHSAGAGRRSEFTVCLPIDPTLQPTHEPAAPHPEPTGSRRLRILVADDNQDGREMLNYLLTSEGHTVAEAADGAAALEVARSFEPDVAILDIGMPGMSGYSVAVELRRRFQGSALVFIALSGLSQPEDKARAAQAGFDRHSPSPST